MKLFTVAPPLSILSHNVFFVTVACLHLLYLVMYLKNLIIMYKKLI